MYTKVFSQIFDSSIAEDYHTRHVFMDLLVLADRDGVIDMTQYAISRRTNVPIDVVTKAIGILSQPDPNSRTPDHEGRRLERLNEHRDWGWRIINYEKYRNMRSETDRKEYMRDFMAKKRASEKAAKEVLPEEPVKEKPVKPQTTDTDTKTEFYADYMNPEQKESETFVKTWREWLTFRKNEKHSRVTDTAAKKQLKMLSDSTIADQAAILNQSMTNGWTGLFPLKASDQKRTENSTLARDIGSQYGKNIKKVG